MKAWGTSWTKLIFELFDTEEKLLHIMVGSMGLRTYAVDVGETVVRGLEALQL